MSETRKILFVCIGNTCRSQMAEGFARTLDRPGIEVKSAGTSAFGSVNRYTASSMMERSIDISTQTSDQLTQELIGWADVVVTLGCEPVSVICPPDFSGTGIDWPIEDPFGGPMELMREVRDDIERRVAALIEEELKGIDDR